MSFIAHKYPSLRDIPLRTSYSWLEGKRRDDEAEGLWRIHDKLYDLTDFIDQHPGGPSWLTLTKGTDITELFEAHHIAPLASQMMSKYEVRPAKERRNYKFTFKEDGFYRTLKRRVFEKLKTIDRRGGEARSKFMIDALLCCTLLLAFAALKFTSILLCLAAGLILTWTIIASHNYFHHRDNWRMYIFNIALLNYKEWRVSHAMSHHIYPNSLYDAEITFFEPIFCYIPISQKSLFQRYGSWIYGPLFYMVFYFVEFIKRFVAYFVYGPSIISWDHLIPFSVPLFMYITTGASLGQTLLYWMMIISAGSFCFCLIGLNAAHHTPEIAHEGDAIRENTDWGIFQLDTVIDRSDLKGSDFLVLVHFGEHALHHLFPILDHSILPQLTGVLMDTLEEFEYEVRDCSWFHHIIGQHRQLARITTSPVIKGLKNKVK